MASCSWCGKMHDGWILLWVSFCGRRCQSLALQPDLFFLRKSGTVTIRASRDFAPFVCGVVGIHPALMPLRDAADCRTPVASLPSSIDDPNFEEFHAALEKSAKVVRPAGFNFDPFPLKPFHDVRHGWCTARGDFEVPLVKQRAEEAFAFTVEFFENCFKLDDERRAREGKNKL